MSANIQSSDTKEILKSHGLKATTQRILIYDAMKALGHASADMVCQAANAGTSAMTVATVYNVLESMTQAGLLARRPSTNNKMYFDITTESHCHLFDEESNTMTDFNDPGLQALVEEYLKFKKPRNFKPARVEIQIYGHSRK